MSEQKAEVIEQDEPETVALEVHDPINDDGMDAVIAVAEKMEAYSKAMDTIINAIIKRSYTGDWVCHAKESDPEDKKKANLGAAAAERIAVFLGVQERNWTVGVKEWSDDRKHFTYTYEADFGFKNRWVHAIGRAGTRDKFFGFAKGAWKALEDVQEDHIRTAAFRACRKEGVRLLLGLRSIPVKKLIELGYDASKINYAGFEDRGKALGADQKQVNADTGMASREITIKKMQRESGVSKKTGKPWTRWDVWDAEGVKYAMFTNSDESKRLLLLEDAYEQKQTVKIEFQVIKNDRGENYQIIKVGGEVDA